MTNQEHSEMMAELTAADIQTLEMIQQEAVWMWEQSTSVEKRAYFKELAETANKMVNERKFSGSSTWCKDNKATIQALATAAGL